MSERKKNCCCCGESFSERDLLGASVNNHKTHYTCEKCRYNKFDVYTHAKKYETCQEGCLRPSGARLFLELKVVRREVWK